MNRILINLINEKLHILFSEATKNNDISRVQSLHEAIAYFYNESFNKNNKEISTQLKQAKTLLKHDAINARKYLESILQSDPFNQKAIELMGIMCYEENNYLLSIHFLSRIMDPTPYE